MGDRVETPEGTLLGRRTGDVLAFTGIPYARAPIAQRRLSPPEASPPWLGVKDARTFGPAPPQLPAPDSLLVPSSAWDLRAPISEDCLNLNVWAMDGGGDRPVLVWFHGGAFIQGAGSQPWYDGSVLARELDAVIVSVNYRLGALGWVWFAGVGETASATSNLGLRDQIEALRWVNRNIGAFGGDPDRVTIAGQSAGAKSVVTLMAVPEAATLFARGISLSGAVHCDDRDRAEDVERMVSAELEVERGDLATMQEIDVTSFATATARVYAAIGSRYPGTRIGAVLDSDVILEQPLLAFRGGASADKPLIVSTAARETAFNLVFDEMAIERDLGAAVESMMPVDPGLGAEVATAYVAGHPDASPLDRYVALESDFYYGRPAEHLLRAREVGGGTSYRCVYDLSGPNPRLGACHTMDIAPAFGSYKLAGMEDFCGSADWVAPAVAQLREAWRSFVWEGVPRLNGRVWPAFDSDERATVHLGPESITTGPPDEGLAAWLRADPDGLHG